jgi:DNA helicase-2/ATP-dependent DNA helicase PcrA
VPEAPGGALLALLALRALGRCVRGVVAAFAVHRERPTETAWAERWRDIVREIARAVSGASLSGTDVDDFLRWPDREGVPESPASVPKNRGNTYHYAKGKRTVAIRVGSIHSAKGETHTATLVLETHWYTHNAESLLPWLDGRQSGKPSTGERQESRLKVHYVAMTRPTHLLCLARKQSSLAGTNDSVIRKLREQG